MFRWIAAVVLTSSAGGLAGCVSAPVQEMSNARQAIRAAREAGAERLAPQILSEAQTLLQQAESSLQRREYRRARRDAIAAHHKAAEALETVQPRPSELRPNSSDAIGAPATADESVLAAR
jgi:hypothetical protein